MVNPLTSDIRVFKILTITFVILTGFFFLFFYFHHVSLAFILGLIMIFVTKRLLISYKIKKRLLSTQLGKVLNVIAIILFWIIAAWFLSAYTIKEVSSIIDDFQNPKTEVAIAVRDAVYKMNEERGVVDKTILETVSSSELVTDFVSEMQNILKQAFFIIPFLFIFYFYKARSIKEKFLHLVPVKFKGSTEKMMFHIVNDLEKYFMTKIRTINAIALILSVLFYIIGLKGAFLVAIATGILHIIPRIGFILAIIMSFFIALMQTPINPSGDFLFTIPIGVGERIFLVLFIQIGVWLFYKLYLKKFFVFEKAKVGLFWELILIVFAAKAFGIMGVLFIFPIFAIYQLVLQEFYAVLISSHSSATLHNQ